MELYVHAQDRYFSQFVCLSCSHNILIACKATASGKRVILKCVHEIDVFNIVITTICVLYVSGKYAIFNLRCVVQRPMLGAVLFSGRRLCSTRRDAPGCIYWLQRSGMCIAPLNILQEAIPSCCCTLSR